MAEAQSDQGSPEINSQEQKIEAVDVKVARLSSTDGEGRREKEDHGERTLGRVNRSYHNTLKNIQAIM